jgi:hypothetical protein
MAAADPLASENASRCGVVRPIFIAPESTPNRTFMKTLGYIQTCIIRHKKNTYLKQQKQ